jgi:predicted DNA-binding ribbon-helix-helix protein
MKSSIVKRSVIIGGHKTSISLEAPFWNGLKAIAALRRMPLSAMLNEIDSGRDNANLSSAVRVFVFEQFRSLALGGVPRGEGGRAGTAFLTVDAPAIG